MTSARREHVPRKWSKSLSYTSCGESHTTACDSRRTLHMSTYSSTPVAKVVYFIDEDPEAAEYHSALIELNGERWIVATWLQHMATGTKHPEYIIPLENMPHVEYESGLIRLGVLMPRQLLEPNAPPELLRKFGVVLYPALRDNPLGPASAH